MHPGCTLRPMPHPFVGATAHAAPEGSAGGEHGEPASELERSVEHAEALVQAAVGRLSRSHPEPAIDGTASEVLRRMRPHLRGALAALSRIEGRRKLTGKE